MRSGQKRNRIADPSERFSEWGLEVADAEPSRGANLAAYASSFRDFMLISGVLLYIIGFSYYDSYLSRFGIGVSLRDIPVYQLFVYSYKVFTSWWCLAYVGVLLVGILLQFSNYKVSVEQPREEKKLEDVLAALITGALFSLVILIPFGWFAAIKGGQDADAIRNVAIVGCSTLGKSTVGTSNVFVLSHEAISRYPSRILSANESGRLQLIYETADAYYVLLHECPPKTEPSAVDSATVFAIRKSDVVTYGVTLPNN